MSYYTGSATSYKDLNAAIQNAVLANGWTAQGNAIFAKNGLFVQLSLGTYGITAYVGTGAAGGALSGSANPAGARLGRISPGSRFPDVTWPATYHIMVHKNPDEVYVILNFNLTHHYWLSFGRSDIPGLPGSGNWFAGCATPSFEWGYYGDGQHYYSISEDAGWMSFNASSGPWWLSSTNPDVWASHGIQTGLDGIDWSSRRNHSSPFGFTSALFALNGLPQGPNPWNGEAVLMPINVFITRESEKASLVLQTRHARYVRIDNYMPGQIITLGHEQWIVFPFAKKNTESRNSTPSDTGTFGWAIRYSES